MTSPNSEHMYKFCQCGVPGSPEEQQAFKRSSLKREGMLASQDQYNPLGATIFIFYILSALILTTRVTFSLYKSYTGLPNSTTTQISFRRRISLLALVALASFSLLSYNMLSFLIQSFLAYRHHHMSDSSQSIPLLKLVWKWTTNSSLFTDFAWELIRTYESFLATEVALMATMFGTLVLVGLGQIYNVQGLWQYLALAQILPVSFSIALILIYCLILQTEKDAETSHESRSEPNQEEKEEPKQRSTQPSLTPAEQRRPIYNDPSTWLSPTQYLFDVARPIVVTLLYPSLAYYTPCAITDNQLLTSVATLRILLAAVYSFQFTFPGLHSATRLLVSNLPFLVAQFIFYVARLSRLPFNFLAEEGMAPKTLFRDVPMILVVCFAGFIAFSLHRDSYPQFCRQLACFSMDYLVAAILSEGLGWGWKWWFDHEIGYMTAVFAWSFTRSWFSEGGKTKSWRQEATAAASQLVSCWTAVKIVNVFKERWLLEGESGIS